MINVRISKIYVTLLLTFFIASCGKSGGGDSSSNKSNSTNAPISSLVQKKSLSCVLDGNKISNSNINILAENWANDNTVPSGTLHRGLIEGVVVSYNVVDTASANTFAIENKWKHERFMIKIEGVPSTSTYQFIEVVHEPKFGSLNSILKVGDKAIICGDYIKSTQPSVKGVKVFQASPAGSIIHFTHKSCNTKHLNGFVAVEATENGIQGFKLFGLEGC